MTDQDRFNFVLDLITGEDSEEANQRTFAIGLAVLKGYDNREAIDWAMGYMNEQACKV